MRRATEYNGAAVLAMTGRNCVAIARCVVCGAIRWLGAEPGWAQCGSAQQHSPTPPTHALCECSDLRLGIQGQTVAMDFEKTFRMTDKLYVGLPGLATDVQTL